MGLQFLELSYFRVVFAKVPTCPLDIFLKPSGLGLKVSGDLGNVLD